MAKLSDEQIHAIGERIYGEGYNVLDFHFARAIESAARREAFKEAATKIVDLPLDIRYRKCRQHGFVDAKEQSYEAILALAEKETQ